MVMAPPHQPYRIPVSYGPKKFLRALTDVTAAPRRGAGRRSARRTRRRALPTSGLLELGAAARLFQGGLGLVGLGLVDALLDGLGGLVDQCLGLLEAQARGGADNLDHLDLLVAGGRQDDV